MGSVVASFAEEVAKAQVRGQSTYEYVTKAFHQAWALMGEDERKAMALQGWHEEVERQRHKFRNSAWFRAEVSRIHAEVGCIFSTHKDHPSRSHCVGHMVMLSEEDRQKRIEAMKAENEKWRAEETEMLREQANQTRQWVSELRARFMSQINLIGADGRAKTLDEFTRSDVEMWETRATGQAEAWGKRSVWFTKARESLDQEGVDRIGGLSETTLAQVDDHARKVWGDEKEWTDG